MIHDNVDGCGKTFKESNALSSILLIIFALVVLFVIFLCLKPGRGIRRSVLAAVDKLINAVGHLRIPNIHLQLNRHVFQQNQADEVELNIMGAVRHVNRNVFDILLPDHLPTVTPPSPAHLSGLTNFITAQADSDSSNATKNSFGDFQTGHGTYVYGSDSFGNPEFPVRVWTPPPPYSEDNINVPEAPPHPPVSFI
jgi:hypothetical protein